MEEVDVIKKSLSETKVHFTISPLLWDRFSKEISIFTQRQWSEVKFLDNDLRIHPNMRTIPNNCGGIYSFVVKPDLVPNSHLYLLYIGRAQYTDNQSLRKRCSEYPKEDRPKIQTMINNWGKYLYIRYLPLTESNDIINKTEAELINAILPPCNDKIPNKTIRQARAAFL